MTHALLALALALPACSTPPGGPEDAGPPGDIDAPSASDIDGAQSTLLDVTIEADADAPGCRAGAVPLDPVPANVMLVLDRSGSMRLGFDGTEDLPPEQWRWTFLRAAVEESVPTLGARARVGAKFFPDPMPPGILPEEITAEIACRCSDGVEVMPTLGSTAAILAAFDASAPAGGTPTAEAIVDAREALMRAADGRRFIVLATDGGPNCNPALTADPATCTCTSAREACLRPGEGIYSCLDDPRTTDVLDETARALGIPVFVVGLDDASRPDLSDYLERMAVAGGRPRTAPGECAFYSVRSDEELRGVFDRIAGEIRGCIRISPWVPTDESRFSVTVDGDTVARDERNGWTWAHRDRGEIELHGPACERANAPGASVLAIVDECPDT